MPDGPESAATATEPPNASTHLWVQRLIGDHQLLQQSRSARDGRRERGLSSTSGTDGMGSSKASSTTPPRGRHRAGRLQLLQPVGLAQGRPPTVVGQSAPPDICL